ncbi:hypothetical protein HY500_02600 [Candidatus Woesearchaeota archaeon]|nr:hypothetical protein [Candidatus Woesearchaeota archaeon]
MNRAERRALEREGQQVQQQIKTEEIKPKKSFKKYIIIVLVVILLLGSIFYFYSKGKGPGRYDGFVNCLSEKGVKFYGSFQCSFCQKQKAMFEKSAKLLDSKNVYVECGPLGNFNSQCLSSGVSSVPLWKIGNESLSGLQQLEVLAEKSECNLDNEKIF